MHRYFGYFWKFREARIYFFRCLCSLTKFVIHSQLYKTRKITFSKVSWNEIVWRFWDLCKVQEGHQNARVSLQSELYSYPYNLITVLYISDLEMEKSCALTDYWTVLNIKTLICWNTFHSRILKRIVNNSKLNNSKFVVFYFLRLMHALP